MGAAGIGTLAGVGITPMGTDKGALVVFELTLNVCSCGYGRGTSTGSQRSGCWGCWSGRSEWSTSTGSDGDNGSRRGGWRLHVLIATPGHAPTSRNQAQKVSFAEGRLANERRRLLDAREQHGQCEQVQLIHRVARKVRFSNDSVNKLTVKIYCSNEWVNKRCVMQRIN
jgi:hypothetical protein